eukprot:jgi/Psemu1/51045/gm1.51045_g
MPPPHTSTPHSLTSLTTFVLTNHPTDTPSHPGTGIPSVPPACCPSPTSSPPPPTMNALNTAHNTYLKTLGLPSNTSVRHILQTSPTIRFSYVDTFGTTQAVHSLVPWSDHTGAPHLAGAHTDSIQAETLISFPSAVFAAFAISITPKNNTCLTLFRTWTDATLLPDNFTTMPQFLRVNPDHARLHLSRRARTYI